MIRLADGTELAARHHGDGDVTVVLLHSYAMDQRVWHKVVALLRDVLPGVGVLVYDHRGHGESGPADERTATIEQLGDDLAEVLGQVRGRVVLVGHGMGGLVAMTMAARHRELARTRVGAFVFLATSVGWVAGALPRPLGRLVQDLHAILGPRLVDEVHRRIDKATTIGLRWLLFGDDPEPDDVRLVAEMVSRHWPEAVALFRPALDAADQAAALAVVTGFDLVAVVGERDRLVPGGQFPHGHAVVVPGAGHLLPLEAVAEVVPRIAAGVRAARER